MRSICRYLGLAVGALLMLMPAAASADCCRVNGGDCNITPPLIHGQSGWLGDVCGTTLSGTNCTAKLDADVTWSTVDADCLTLGSGVTLDLDGHTMTCDVSSPDFCGTAVYNTTSSSGIGKVLVKNGAIVGRWGAGIEAVGGSSSSAADLVMDGPTGLYNLRGGIDRVTISNCATGIELWPGSDVTDSMIRDCGIGISAVWSFATYATSEIDNVVLLRNNYSMFGTVTGTGGPPSMQRSEVKYPGLCNCAYLDGSNPNQCRSFAICADVHNTTTPSFIEDEITPR